MATTLPTMQSRTLTDSLTKQKLALKVFAHGPGYTLPERVVVEIETGVMVTIHLSTDDAAWLGHALLSARDDALRMAGPDYPDSPAGDERHILGDDWQDAGDRAWNERKDAGAKHSVMDPRD